MPDDIREHNRFYLREDRREQPKEYFKFLDRLAAVRLGNKAIWVLDIGCATGDFLWFLRTRWPSASLTGIDVSKYLLDTARERIPAAEFFCADVYSNEGLPKGQWDIVFMAGVHTYFPDAGRWLNNVLQLVRPGGIAYIFGPFNPEPLDVIAQVRRAGETEASTPYVLMSQASVGMLLESKRSTMPLTYRFLDWEMPFSIEREREDPLRSWTIRTHDGRHLTINGTQMLIRFSALEILREES